MDVTSNSLNAPQLVYILGRYVLFTCLISIAVAVNSTSVINCYAVFLVTQVTGSLAIGLASLTFSLRTSKPPLSRAVWDNNAYITVLIIVLTAGQWFCLLHGVLVQAEWMPGLGCVVVATSNETLAIGFIYTMVFDFTILCLSATKLWRNNHHAGRTFPVSKMLFRDGLIYFLVTFVVKLAATIFLLMDLNAVMSIILNVPAAAVSMVMASHAVRRLTELREVEEEFIAGSESLPTFDPNQAAVGQAGTQEHGRPIELNAVVDRQPAPVQDPSPSRLGLPNESDLPRSVIVLKGLPP
ncbi:hypothetical protein BD410DRAFT_841059 [Rickenella mellea]|uniref:G-protein coupled receptors family 1 profile domain-containing protein n=1 Tax=Rickenella mellea TaxID=50990 RepID=A0A4Y7Q0L4_9AGAM|nr:hypothetical protein BD410DRAFT_841059 [Rickenella mellea]